MKSGYCTIMWNGRVHGANEMNHHEAHQRPVFIQRRWCCVYGEIGMESSIMRSSGKPNFSFQQVLLPVRPTEGSTQWKASGISQKCIIFLQDNIRLHVSLMTRQKTYSLTGKLWFICSIHQMLQLWVSICFGLYKILLMEKIFNFLEDWKRHL